MGVFIDCDYVYCCVLLRLLLAALLTVRRNWLVVLLWFARAVILAGCVLA